MRLPRLSPSPLRTWFYETIDRITIELKEYNNRIYNLANDDAKFERSIDEYTMIDIKIDKYQVILDKLFDKMKPKLTVSDQLTGTPSETKPRLCAKLPDLKTPTFNDSHLE